MEPRRVLWINAGFSGGDSFRPTPWQNVCRPPSTALNELNHKDFDTIVLEFPLPHWTPDTLLAEVQKRAPEIPVLLRDPETGLSDAVRLARLGLYQMLEHDRDPSPIIAEAIQERLRRSRDRVLPCNRPEAWETLLVGGSQQMRRVCHLIRMVGCRRSTVLITGETGTGKELAARALHLAGPRRTHPLIAVNCSALPATLMEAELFGHVRGAFTGAVQARIGRFEQANGGTLFLDEIGELPLDLQAKLLRVLQEREFQRLGSSETVRVDIRVVAATNCDLARKIESREFREDLYYRLNVVPLHLPALRDRLDDVPLLAAHFVDKICSAEGLPRKALSPEAVGRLCGYLWPGNVRQLENAVEMAIALSGDRALLSAADFPLADAVKTRLPLESVPLVSVPPSGLDYESTLACIERSILEQALEKTGGNKKAAAQMLRLKRTTLSAKVRSLAAVS
ncbi:MAG: Fis family transcriptional regulator [Terriglobia bacterium]|nr:MAG: Fis family transcriptional regulator [Terriglobia bacterium]